MSDIGKISKAELLAMKRRKLALLRKRAELTKGFGMLSYVPHTLQDKFHRAGAKRRRLCMSGNRFGKSHMGSAEDCAWLYGERVWYPKGDPARTVGIPSRPVKGLVITTDWDKVEEIWTSQKGERPGKLWQMLPSDFVKSTHRNHAGAMDLVECQNGSMIAFDTVKSWKQNPQGSESSDWDFVHIDEPCPANMFKAVSRGLVDRGGSAWFTLTPLSEVWIVDMFFPAKLARKDLPQEYAAEDSWVLRGSMLDNPYLSAEGKKDYIATLTPEEIQCRVNGVPLELAGLIYKEFDWSKHVMFDVPRGWSAYNDPPKGYTIYAAIDPHPQTPHAVLFIAVNELQQIFVFDEIWEHCQISELCVRIHHVLKGRNVAWIKCDPLAYINDPITGGNMDDEFARHGVYVEKATKALTQGIMRVKDELKKEGRIFVSPHCERFLWEIQRYCWDPDTGKPVDANDHFMENFYRLLLDEPTFIRMSEGSRPVEDLVINTSQLRLDDLVEAMKGI